VRDDAERISTLVRELAKYEREPDSAAASAVQNAK